MSNPSVSQASPATQASHPTLQLPQSVRREVLEYRSRVDAFLRGDTSAVAFRGYRVPMGIYEQRTPGRYMVRVRIGAGVVLPGQLRRIAQLSKAHGNGILHVTTRQDIQIHDIAIEDTAAVLEGLLEEGLSSRGGGGNTVRNISACPRSGICAREWFDVAPYAIALAEYLLQHKGSFNLPRKYKIAFSGCSEDCALASVADLGFFAQVRNGRRGFSVYAAGGLGGEPRAGIRIEEFVAPEDVFEVAEAVRRLFDKHGDRANKHRARLRHVLGRIGEEQFEVLYQNERAALRREGLPGVVPGIRTTEPEIAGWRNEVNVPSAFSPGRLLSEKEPGKFTIRLRLPLGEISADDLVAVAQVAEEYGAGTVRTTQHQDLLIPGVPVEHAYAALESLKGLAVEAGGPKIVTCTGASTCKLGLCLSKELARAISRRFQQRGIDIDDSVTVIRISGCPNGCGGHHVAEIGLEGATRRVNGKLMPHYTVLAGGHPSGEGAKLAERIATVPAKRIPDLLAAAANDGIIDADRVRALAPSYETLPDEVPEDYYRDFGSEKAFSLAGRGPGECGAGVLDVIRVDIQEAKDALDSARAASSSRDADEALYRALVAAARSLLVVFGIEAKKDREVFASFERLLIGPGWVAADTSELVDAALDWRIGDRESISEYAEPLQNLVQRVETLFLSLDSELKFRIEPARGFTRPAGKEASANQVNLRGVACPLNFVKAKVALEKIPVGEVLEVLLDEGEPVRNVPMSFAEQGQEVLEVTPRDNYSCVRVRRKK